MKYTLYGLAFSLIFLAGCAGSKNPSPAYTATTNTVSSTDQSTSSSTTGVVSSTVPLSVKWNIKKISSQHLFPSSTTTAQVDHFDEQASYFDAGKLTYHGRSAELIFVSAEPNYPGGPDRYFFIQQGNKLAVLVNESAELRDVNYQPGYAGDGLDRSKFTVDTESTIPSLHSPGTISKGPRQLLEFKETTDVSSDVVSSLIPSFDDPIYGKVQFSTKTKAYYVKLGPIFSIYSPKIDFYDDGLVPQITFNDGTTNTQEYYHTTSGGCGSSNYEAVVPPGQINIQKDLIQVGQNNQGDPIFILTNTSSKRLKDLYENSYYVPENEKKLSFTDYLTLKPLLYWVDPFGNLVELQNLKLVPQAECGKPVIYLYPKQTTTTTVWLQPQGGFTYTEPNYVVNWLVKAQPNGHLTDIRTGKEYPYLFWEGRGGFYEQPKKGWVVKRASVKTFLQSKLLQLGLNHDESADFMDFWLPRMQAKPYYFVTFMGNSTMDTLAPLTVDPRPDTVIRILMDFTPLDKPIKVQNFTIRTPKRQGFTVIEWGGVLR